MKHLLFLAMPYEAGESGISRYIQATLKALAKDYRLTVWALASDIPALQVWVPAAAQVSFEAISDRYAGALANIAWFHAVLPRKAQALHQKDPLDAVFFPAGNRRLSPALRWFLPTVPRWITIHDLAPMRLKKYDASRQLYTTRYLPACYRREERLIAISQQTADDLVTLAGVDPAVVQVSPNGYEPLTLPEQEPVLPTRRPFVLFTGRLEHPAKNHEALIRAWGHLPDAVQQRYALVFVGKDWTGAEWIHQCIATYRQEHPEGELLNLGFVDDAVLAHLYQRATVYVQPSLYEGFGLPLLEAMAAKTPVLSSTRGALPEVGGDTVSYTEPDSVSLCEQLQTLLHRCEQQDPLLSAQVERAAARVQLFSWHHHVQAFDAEHTPPLKLLGHRLFNGSQAQFLQGFRQALAQGLRQQVFFMNADCFNLSVEQGAYRQTLKQADWLLPDGAGVALGARVTGQRLTENLNGTDLFPVLCEQAVAQQWRVFFLGGREAVVQQLVQNLRQQYPQLQIQGYHSGYFSAAETAQIFEAMTGTDLLFVAMGAPLQEQWIQQHWERLPVRAAFGVGGLFDFYSGRIARAPQGWRRLGLEWVWRLLQEPQRLWRRYLLGNPRFVARVLRWRQHGPQGVEGGAEGEVKQSVWTKASVSVS